MGTLVEYTNADGVSTIRMDDGKANALSPQMLSEINAALDQAAEDNSVVILTGRKGMLSAGFDLGVLGGGGVEALDMLNTGFKLAARLLSFTTPVIVACSGHAVAMGSFLLLSADYRIGTQGAFKIQANEVAIGMTMPWTAIELCKARLTPAASNRAMLLSEPFTPDGAVTAGFLDQVVSAEELEATANGLAQQFGGLNMGAHTASKLRAREQFLANLNSAIKADDDQLRASLNN